MRYHMVYGQALTKIKVNNLINKTKFKGMLVTVDFEYNGSEYRIEQVVLNVFRLMRDGHDMKRDTR